MIWPYFCGNLFPCHSQPADGETFELAIDGVASGKQAVYPSRIDREAVLGQVGGPALEAAQWHEYQQELDDAIAEGGAPAWPQGCNQIDIIKDKLFTNLPYMEGAFFYKDVAAAVGADKLDQVLHDFYAAHHGRAAGMQDMIDLIKQETGFDTSALVESRLRHQF